MKELIKMKPNWSIKNEIHKKHKIIAVCNYDGSQNEICNFSFLSKKTLLRLKFDFDIGCWQPKGTKEKELKSK